MVAENVDEHCNQCKKNLKRVKPEGLHQSKEAAKNIKNWLSELNRVKVDEKQWDVIKEKCEISSIDLKQLLNKFESELLLNERNKKQEMIESFFQMTIQTFSAK